MLPPLYNVPQPEESHDTGSLQNVSDLRSNMFRIVILTAANPAHSPHPAHRPA